MFSVASRTSFTVALVAFFVAIGAVFANHDRVGFGVLVTVTAVATIAGLAFFYFTPRDPLIPASPDVEAATVRTVDPTDLPKPSIWPFVSAVAVALLGVGAALGRSILFYGVIGIVLASLGWLAQVWREHPSWTGEMSRRLNDRFVVPIGLPVTIIVLAGIGVVSLSRVLLAVSKNAAVGVASIIAFVILGVFWLLSTRPQLGRALIGWLVATASALVVGAGIGGAMAGEREFHTAGHETDAVRIVAEDLQFNLGDLRLPASVDVHLVLDNRDAAPHNVSIYESKGGAEIFIGPIIQGGETVTYEFESPAPGTYYFQCDVHPDTMVGQVETAEPASDSEIPGEPQRSGNTPTSLQGH